MSPKLRLPDPIEQARLSDAVYETLLEAIVTGYFSPGTVVSEVALAEKLQVSRTPVHDALKQLARDGLVEQQAKRRAKTSSFSPDDVHDIFEMRKLLEGEAARRAAARIDRATLARLRGSADALAGDPAAPDWVARWADFDEDFHAAIAQASGSRRLSQDIQRYRLIHRCFNRLATTPDVLAPALREHLRILDALERRDADRAAREMVEHIHEWQAYFVAHFPR